MNLNPKPLTEKEIQEVKDLLTAKGKVTIYVALITAAAAMISAIGTAVASLIIALKTTTGER